jgi:glutathione synthase
MRILFILDPLDTLKAYKDTSIAIMREAITQGHEVLVALQQDITARNEKILFFARSLIVTNHPSSWYTLGEQETLAPTQVDVILMRKDPPFDNEYLYSTYLLSQAAKQGGRVINNPDAIRSWNEKLGILRFPQFAPPFIVTRQQTLIREFLAEHQDIVIKPLDGMGGSRIFRVKQNDPNIGVILEIMTRDEQETVMAQRYIPEIIHGDKRIILINGEPVPYALARIPQNGETRGNLAAGGKGVAQPLTQRDIEIAETVGRVLKAEGLFIVGLDVIGDYLPEVNVTSPTGMVEILNQTTSNPAKLFIDSLVNIMK